MTCIPGAHCPQPTATPGLPIAHSLQPWDHGTREQGLQRDRSTSGCQDTLRPFEPSAGSCQLSVSQLGRMNQRTNDRGHGLGGPRGWPGRSRLHCNRVWQGMSTPLAARRTSEFMRPRFGHNECCFNSTEPEESPTAQMPTMYCVCQAPWSCAMPRCSEHLARLSRRSCG